MIISYKILVEDFGILVASGKPLDPELSMLENILDNHIAMPLEFLQNQLVDIKLVMSGEKAFAQWEGIGELDPYGKILIGPEVTVYESDDYGEQQLSTRVYCKWVEQFIHFVTRSLGTFPRNKRDYQRIDNLNEGWSIWYVMQMNEDEVVALNTEYKYTNAALLNHHFSTALSYSYYENLLEDMKDLMAGSLKVVERENIYISDQSVIIRKEDFELEIPLDVYRRFLEDWLWFINFVKTNFNCTKLAY